MFILCWESLELEWWALVGDFIKPLFSGQAGEVDRRLIRRCLQEGIRGVSHLEIANLVFAAYEKKKVRDSWWTLNSEESEGDSKEQGSGEGERGSEESSEAERRGSDSSEESDRELVHGECG